MSKNINKNKKGKRTGRVIFSLFLIFILLVAGYWGFENFTFKIDEVEILNPKIAREIEIVHLSDLHGAKFCKDNSALIHKIDKINPDLVMVTGDMYTSTKIEKHMPVVLNLMEDLAQKYSVYFVPGEHDHDEDYISRLGELGVTVLLGEKADITVKGTEMSIYGVDQCYFPENYDIADFFEPLDNSRYNILLAHVPQYKNYINFGFNLTLCGDTHGGIANLPFFGVVNYNGEWFPEYNQSHKVEITVKGLYSGKTQYDKFYVSGGLGNYPLPARFMNRAEFAHIILKNTSAE